MRYKYGVNDICGIFAQCFIEMERGEDAEKMAEAYKENRPKFEGKRLVVYVSRKYKQLKHGSVGNSDCLFSLPKGS